MSELRSSHAVWVLRRAVALEARAAEGPVAAADRVRAARLRAIADKITAALEAPAPFRLTPDERAGLLAEARELAEQIASELRRSEGSDLAAAEVWSLTVRALCEVAGAGE